ncbi:MAG TPA: hypothetical protein VGY66_18715 [Gemmataceae bacterium]|jgi:hypothetical protein|nr:hypothetical protein [Gemmataceae bacterium]
MTETTIERRLVALEAEVMRLKESFEKLAAPERPWWKEVAGTFVNDPIYEEAMRLGRQYRESLRPKPRKKRKGSNGRPGHRPS